MKSYERDLPQLVYSNPKDGENPKLVRFGNLNEASDDPELPVKDADGVARRYRVLRLPRLESGEVFLHIYNTTGVGLRLRFYGVSRGGETEVLPEVKEVRGALARLRLRLADGFDWYLVRFGIGLEEDGNKMDFGKLDYFSVAAYDGREPASPGGISVAPPSRKDGQQVHLPFSHNGRSFQRLVISTCDPEDDVRALLRASKLEVAESYFGKLGSVVAVGVPPGMSLNTGVDTTRNIRQKGNSGEGTVSEDYIVNLFSPRRPTDKNEGNPDKWHDRRTEPNFAMPAFRPPHPRQFDGKKAPLTVAIIDSGIDYSANNAGHWKSTRYQHGPDTEYVTPGAYGYDFIHRREEPADEAPHGTYVAAALLNQYRADRPLQLLHMKVFGAAGIASYFGSLVSIYEAATVGASVINMSWGFYQREAPAALYCAIKTAAKRGVIMVASAGNDGENLDQEPQWPAAFADDFPCNLITVASYSHELANGEAPGAHNIVRAGYSNFGQREVPLAAFLTSPVPEFNTGDTHYPVGTSISAPVVAGVLANWLAANPHGTLAEFRKAFYDPADSLKPEIANGHYLPLSASPWTV